MLVFALCATACGPDGLAVAECAAGPFEVFSEGVVDCALVSDSVTFVQKALNGEGVVRAEDFDREVAGIAITVRLTEEWISTRGNAVTGEFSIFTGVQVGPSMEALAHELLHAYDTRHWKFDTISHHDWDGRGYTMADRRFRAAMQLRR
jgi:hypothetical protein